MKEYEMKMLFIILLILPTVAESAELHGVVTHVRDGDTIEVKNIPIRLKGISAPELRQPLGQQSKTFMQKLVLGKFIICKLTGEKTYDRFVGTCHFDQTDLSIAIIKAGLAIDCPKYSNSLYSEFETLDAKKLIKLPSYCFKD